MTALPRLFHLQRDHDVTGVSGTGRVADGVLWPDGTVSIRWTGPMPSAVFWHSLANALHVHGHGGATRIVWADEQPPADRAAVLREAAALVDQRASSIDALSSSDFGEEARAVRELAEAAETLRRMADENPSTPSEQCPRSEFEDYGQQCQKPAGHNLCSFEEHPAAGARQDGEA